MVNFKRDICSNHLLSLIFKSDHREKGVSRNVSGISYQFTI